MSNQATFEEIGQVLRDHDSFVVASHVRPDGDAIGSILALGHALEGIGKRVRYLNEDGCPESLAFLPGSEKVEVSSQAGAVDVEIAICLDTAAHSRVGPVTLEIVNSAKMIINIDHHISNPGYGKLNFIDDKSPATGQIIYNLIKALDLPLSEISRDSIYVATSTDTGSFQYPGTTQQTYEMAADLVAHGLNIGEINQLTYDNQPYRRVELLRSLLNALELSEDGRIGWWHLTNETKEKFSLIDDDTEGMIDHIRSIQGVIIAVFFEELDAGKIRVSMRSKDKRINCSELCGIFGGGGHALAAGIRMAGPLSDARDKVLAEVRKAIDSL
ncbi:bifunctional oligoribonuclease/PAP phosphatase NrnA [Akkermansiaceae bacterium]|nr:bifunctional oligoribonuclease/PAP phosphatase NrnA [Akkermansiaceae bacterium]MDB4374709.1 bifunctional oligoribonuclease/PAP phosphatase NrnA [bacterium]MDB0068305.1 bifunctional oligoribonuclease/PAP phosphatase NrnA [Akkermansiaceae bacterium]MDB4143781.1 bifunctional oligoribonuclease/PAP phosphatase NrnA [Akkermansiaceae bacterium]MDB4434060.1 bifunctional oligoribonuclease/PAP phosphatase NrnA [Akkermansiaceae bacterium]